jgi:hypothetical protein
VLRSALNATSVLQIMNGVHENMLSLPYMDHSMEKTVAMCEWLQHFDVWHGRCMSHMQFELMPLLPTAALAISHLCRSALLPAHACSRCHAPAACLCPRTCSG